MSLGSNKMPQEKGPKLKGEAKETEICQSMRDFLIDFSDVLLHLPSSKEWGRGYTDRNRKRIDRSSSILGCPLESMTVEGEWRMVTLVLS